MNSLQKALIDAKLVDKKKVDEYNSQKRKMDIEKEKLETAKELKLTDFIKGFHGNSKS